MWWITSVGEKVVNALGDLEQLSRSDDEDEDAYLTKLRNNTLETIPEDKLLDLSEAQKSVLLEHGVNFVINREGTRVQIFVDVNTGFKAFLDILDTRKACLKRKPRGPAGWTLFNVRSDPELLDELSQIFAVDYREKWKAPTTPPDILLIGAYMKEAQIRRDQQIMETRGERYITSEGHPGDAKYEGRVNGHPDDDDDGFSRVRVLRKFESHREVKEKIRAIQRRDIVVATPEEWRIYRLVKLVTGSELTFLSLVKKWASIVRSEEFDAYESGSRFDYLGSMRRFLDSRSLFGGVLTRDKKQTLDPSPSNGRGTTKFEGLRSKGKERSYSDESPHSSSLVNVSLTLANEYEQRKELFVLIEEYKESLFAAMDGVLDEFRRAASNPEFTGDKFGVPCVTLENMVRLRDQIEDVAPEMFYAS